VIEADGEIVERDIQISADLQRIVDAYSAGQNFRDASQI
jgi:hypothetical protein